jgi:hypothetical protein
MVTVVASFPVPRQIGLEREPLPLPQAGWGATEAQLAVAEARLVVDIPPAVVVSALTTVVLRAERLAVKVYPPGTDPDHLSTVSRELASTPTAVVLCQSPIVTSFGVVTVTPWLDADRQTSWPKVGSLLRRFHAETTSASLAPWLPLRRLCGQVDGLPDEWAETLLRAREVLLAELASTRSVIGEGAIHGDVSPANVLSGPAGAQLIDLDFAAHGPREYDLASAARRARSGEIDAASYRRFCRKYGYDVREWEGLPLLDHIAELGGVAFRLWDSRHHGRDLDWLPAVVTRWRTPL